MTAEVVEATQVVDAYPGLLDSVRGMLDRLASSRLDAATVSELTHRIEDVRERLGPYVVDESAQDFGRRFDLPDRGQTLVPSYAVRHAEPDRWSGIVTFGRYHLGRNGAVHGGSLALFFEDVMGQLAISAGRSFGRAAYTHVDFRALSPIETELTFHAWIVSEIGRKRLVRAELRDGDTTCVEAEGLIIELGPHQH